MISLNSMKTRKTVIVTTILLLFSILPLAAENSEPEWVALIKAGNYGELTSPSQYAGSGTSKLSQDFADRNARLDFAKVVETKVESSFEERLKITDGKESRLTQMSSSVKTDVSLKGVTVSERYFDKKARVWYSLIIISRKDYIAILENNIAEELALSEAELKQRQEENRREEQRLAEEQKEWEQEQRRYQLAQEKKRNRAARYAPFLEQRPREKIIHLPTGDVAPRIMHINAQIGVYNDLNGNVLFEFTQAEVGVTFLKFMHFSGTTVFKDDDSRFTWGYQDLDLKFRLLNGAGTSTKSWLAIGAKGWCYNMSDLWEDTSNISFMGTPYVAYTLSLPHLWYTQFTVYAGIDKAGIGAEWYPLFPWWKDHLTLITEFYFVFLPDLWDVPLQNKFFEFAIGLRFQPAEFISAYLTYEKWTKAAFGIDIYI